MIEVVLTGTVQLAKTYRENGSDGHAEYSLANTVKRTVEVSATKEFHHGYVNLEGYVLSRHWLRSEDALHQFGIPENDAIEDWRILEDSADLEVEMRGEAWDWIEQAVRYVTERPALSVIDALEQFRSWDETDADVINRADSTARSATAAVNTESGSFSDGSWNRMLKTLQNEAGRDGHPIEVQQFKNEDATPL